MGSVVQGHTGRDQMEAGLWPVFRDETSIKAVVADALRVAGLMATSMYELILREVDAGYVSPMLRKLAGKPALTTSEIERAFS